jgi:site-specific recombinase XerD
MRQTGKATKYAGIEMIAANKFRVRARVMNPRTGKAKEVDRLVEGPGVTIQDAVKQRAEWIAHIKAGGVATVGQRERKTLSDFARYFIGAKEVSLEKESAEVYATALNTFAPIADVYLDAITSADVQKVVQDMLARGLKPSTVRHKVRVLRTLFHFAMKQTPPLVDRDPTLAVSLPKVPKLDDDEKTNKLTGEELARALRVAEDEHPERYPMLLLLACTGIRYTHVSALCWEDIDFDKGVINFKRKQVRGRVGRITDIKLCPKFMPLRAPNKPELQVLEDVLRAHRQALVAAQHPGLRQGWCFPSARGTCNTWNDMRKLWRQVQTRAGIAAPCSLHGLRHTFHDLTRDQGIDQLVVRSITRHSNEAQTEKYSAVALREKAKAVNGVLRVIKLGDSAGDAATQGEAQATE